jgi:hypothetical protein
MAVDIKKIPSSHRPDRDGSIRGILRNYPNPINVITEFIQNAEDAQSAKIRFGVLEHAVRIANDGDPFDERDFSRVCKFAQGKWGETEKIGRFGVGFISSYHLTDTPTIISNGVSVTIQPDGSIRKREHIASRNTKGSTFSLPLRRRLTSFSERIAVEEVNNHRLRSFVSGFKDAFYRGILFLSNVRIIEGWEWDGKGRRLICRCTSKPIFERNDPLSDGSVLTFKRIVVCIDWHDPESGKMLSEEHKWHIFTQDFRENYLETYNREPPGKTKVALAFKLSNRRQGEVGILYAYLPTKIQTGLNFNMNAHFAPRTGRDDIRDDESNEGHWNRWLISCLGKLTVNIVDYLKKEVQNPLDFYEVIPVACAEEREYLKTIVDTFIDGAKDKAIVYSSHHRWLTRSRVSRVDEQLRRIVEGSRLEFVAKEAQRNGKATKLFDEIDLRWFETRDLVTLLNQVPCQCELRKAPRFARTPKKIAAIYRYLDEHHYDGMWDELKKVSLCLDQSDILHPFDSDDDRVYVSDTEMRQILRGSDVPLVKEALWRNFRRFLEKLVKRFDMDSLIEYLDNARDDLVGKKLGQSPTPILDSLPKSQRIYKYLSREKVFEKSKYGANALQGTPLCIAEDDTIHNFDRDVPPVYLASNQIRTMLFKSGNSFVKPELQKYKTLLIEAGVREFGVDDVLLFLQEHTEDGIPFERAVAPLNTKNQLVKVYNYLRQVALNQQQLEVLKSIPVFLTSRGNLRPLAGSDQGALALRSGRISDPLNLDNLLDDIFGKHRQLRKWLKDRLDVRELYLATYISDYLIPQYATAPEDVKLDLLRMLRANLKVISRSEGLQEALRSVELIQCKDGEYRCGSKVCFKNRSIDVAFGDSYYYPNQAYARSGKSRSLIKKEEWGDLFTMLGVRRIPDPQAVIRAARSVARSEPTQADVQRARQLLRFLSNHWREYEEEQEELEELRYLAWLPAAGDWNQLYYPDALHAPELKSLVGTQVTFLAISGIDERLAQFLDLHTKAETNDIVNHLLVLSEKGKPANLAIYEELSSRGDSDAIQNLRHRDVVDVTGRGDFWNPDKLFLGECTDFGRYRRRLPDNLRRFGWLFEEIGVRSGPEPKDYVALLIEISDTFSGEHLPAHEKSMVCRAYARLANNLEEIEDEQLEELRIRPVVLATDGRLYQHTRIFINDYPDHTELELSREPVFCVSDVSVEEFLKQLPVAKLSKALYPRLISVENERLDEDKTRLMHEIWAEPILRVNFSLLDSGRDLASDRSILSSTEIHIADRIKVQWCYKQGEEEIAGAALEHGAYYNYPILYLTDDDEEYGRLHMARELARILAPEADSRTLAIHYETILGRLTPDSINHFLRIHRYRTLPLAQLETNELAPPYTDTGLEPGGEREGQGVEGTLGEEGGEQQPRLGGGRETTERPSEQGQRVIPRLIDYVDTSRLKVVEESSGTPEEARPFSIGVTASKRTGYVAGGVGGTGNIFTDENKETESVAFKLVEKYEEDHGWNTYDNKGKGYIGYDIRARKGEEVKYIEVKSSRSWNCPDLSFPQLMEARKKRHRYYLYRVFNLERSESPPVLYIVRDPWGYLDVDVAGYTTKGYRENPRGDIKKVILREA